MELQEVSANTEPKLTKLGLRLNLFRSTYFISVTGIIISIFGIIGGITTIVLPTALGFQTHRYSFNSCRGLQCFALLITSIQYGIGALSLAITIGWLVMNFLLLRRCKEKNVPAIENITKIVSYIIGVVELLALIIPILINTFRSDIAGMVIPIVLLAIDLVFVSLKIHGIRIYNNGLVKAYIIYRYIIYILSFLAAIGTFIWALAALHAQWQWWFLGFVTSVVSFVMVMQELGQTVILYSIRLSNEKRSTSIYLNSK